MWTLDGNLLYIGMICKFELNVLAKFIEWTTGPFFLIVFRFSNEF